MRSALSAKLADEALYVVDGFSFEKPSTKQAAEILKSLGITGRVTVVVANDDINAILSFRNLAKVRVITASEANTYDLVDNTAVLFTQAGSELARGGAVLMYDPRDIIIRPVISEKSYDMIEHNRYTFEVAKTATQAADRRRGHRDLRRDRHEREHDERHRQAAPRARCQGQDA